MFNEEVKIEFRLVGQLDGTNSIPKEDTLEKDAAAELTDNLPF